jgi:diguanylate cyclase (GGDEF)-like protein/PAS domain S-box-containing protein/putative nucleotidyltransferase with HDIG domain
MIVFLNEVAEELTGWTQNEAVGRPLEQVFQVIDHLTNKKYSGIVQNVMDTGIVLQIEQNALLVSRNGREYPIESKASPIKQTDGEIAGAVLVFRDCSERQQRLDAIEYLSYHDQLTGLYNRRYFDYAMGKLDEASQLPLTLMMIDVNGLKLINDSFGHAAGDDLLQKVAEILTHACRNRDVLARIGGDEFVIILPNTDREAADRVLNAINTSLTQRRIDSGVLSLSIGLGSKTDPSQSLDQVYKSAEDAMYRNKLYESTSMRNKTIGLITNVLFEKSQREMIHSRRVGKICENIAYALGFDSDAVSRIRIGGLMHDIGKIGIAENILNKPEALTDEESEEMKKHPEIGYRILLSVPEFSEVAESILAHHERWDGKGYPQGLKGEEIPLQARIITVADTFEAMTSDRSYRKAVSHDEAITELQGIAGTQLDPKITAAFIEVLKHPNAMNFTPYSS